MELWIRNQDKTTLIKVNKICFERNIDNEPTIYGYENYDNYERLGVYNTKERALEVLDEIHQRLIDIQCLEIIKETTAGMKKRGVDCVYIMPQE